MTIDFENALAGEHGAETQAAAEEAVRYAVDSIAKMIKPSIDAALAAEVASGDFASGGTFTVPKPPIRALDGECVLPLESPLSEVTRRAVEGGFTELRFNPETMGWTYHRPDEAVGEDGRRYIRVQAP